MADEELGRSVSIFGKKGPKLPKNWKKAKEKDGTIYYFNTVTQQKRPDFPPALPPGWREALHKESGRVYYYHKETRQSTFEFPTAGEGDDDGEDGEDPGPPEGFFGRTISKFTGKKKDGLGRSTTMSRTATITKKEKKKEEKKDEGGDGGPQKTVFISCSTLIKEVKLCVEPSTHPPLDALFEKLTNHQIPAEQAVRQLMELVGSTVVQQAGLSVMNAQKGVLPHGWLEYTDEASGRPYYYNVHTKVTTWYKPTGAVPPPPPEIMGEDGEGDAINLDCSLETHNVAMTGFI